MLCAVFVAGDEAAAHLAVICVLAVLVEQPRGGVETLDGEGADRRLVTQPDRRPDHQNISGHHLFQDLRPLVGFPAVLGHVGVYAVRQVVVHRPERAHAHPVLAHDGAGNPDQAVGMGRVGRSFEGAVEKNRAQVGVVGGHGGQFSVWLQGAISVEIWIAREECKLQAASSANMIVFVGERQADYRAASHSVSMMALAKA